MNFLISLITTCSITFNSIGTFINLDTQSPRIIDAITLAYHAMYTETKNHTEQYIILDMESVYFVDTTYEERETTLSSFNKYNKIILNSSLFKFQQMGLANKLGELKINGRLLMIENINFENNVLIIEGTNWFGPVDANLYKVELLIENNKWTLKNIKLIGTA